MHRSANPLFSLILSLFLGMGAASAKETVRLTNGEWKPFQSEDLPDYGPYSKIATLAFAEAGLDVEYGFFPWNRAVKLVQDGHWDGTFFWVATEERRRDFLLSDPVITFHEVLFYSLDRPLHAETLEDFSGLTMGRIQSSAFGRIFDPLIAQDAIHLTVVPTNENLFQMLASGRVDFVPELIHSGYAAVDALPSGIDRTRITHSDAFSQTWVYHMLISRRIENGPDLLRKFNLGLKRLREKGLVAKIMAPILERRAPAAQ